MVVQRLGLSTFIAGTRVPDQGAKIPKVARPKNKKYPKGSSGSGDTRGEGCARLGLEI